MKIDKVRIVGFKSFADPVEFSIGSGVTAIVGPNGCGKSNLIEAIRWAMGETSAKRIRADGMDDVVFGGTDSRPARASCEVTIVLDNTSRTAPAEFNDSDRIEVVRRLERGDGSSYRVNGKPARARDVQILFQDAGAGAGSASLVSQGKVAAIIQAKPSERRSILEEAAGTAGIATRRHEAELRLRATEQNLERAEDIENGLSDQVAILRKQARQAARRRSIDGQIRAAEALVFMVRYTAAAVRAEEAKAEHEQNERLVAEAMLAAHAAEADLRSIREEVAPIMAERQRAETVFALAQSACISAQKDADNAKSALAAAQRNVQRAIADLARERENLELLVEELETFNEAKLIAEDAKYHDAPVLEEKVVELARIEDEYRVKAARVEELSARAAAENAVRAGLEARLRQAEGRVTDLLKRSREADEALALERGRLETLPDTDAEAEQARNRLDECERALLEAVEERGKATSEEDVARIALTEVASRRAAAHAELAGLEASTGIDGDVPFRVQVQEGMEAAFAAALGEGVSAKIGARGPRWWVKGSGAISPPSGTDPLSWCVEAPEELSDALSGIGVAANPAEAERLAASLSPGQAIVTPDGGLWRWDGFRRSGADNDADEMKRAARIKELRTAEEVLLAEETEANRRRELASNRAALARERERACTEAVRAARAAMEGTVKRLAEVTRQRNAVTGRISALEIQARTLASEIAIAQAELDDCRTTLAQRVSENTVAQELLEARAALGAVNERLVAERKAHEHMRRKFEENLVQIAVVTERIAAHNARITAQRTLCSEMEARIAEARIEEERVSALAAEAPALVNKAQEEVDAAAAALEEAKNLTRASEERLAAAEDLRKQNQERVSALREQRAGLLAELKAANEVRDELTREIGDRLSCAPADLAGIAGIETGAELPDIPTCEARIAKLVRERDALGAVNPLAEQQMAEMEARLGEARRARDELREAIARLRRTISEFDREARSRLTSAFTEIDGHFRDLYTRLFGGGHAHLSLSGSDDILQAGLEVYACPPGKKLQTMSLLSGGEQALAALALVFAAFMVKPAPVCVLDEVDAPLDDANVNRLCSLVADMARDDATRFLVVTHHALTMARSDRLYGVTMAERGVSKLAVIDMEAATTLIGETAAV